MPKLESSDAVRVEGLAALRRGLADAVAGGAKELGKANQAAAEIITKAAVTRAGQLGGVAAHVAPSIKAAARAREAVVSIGSERFPMALGAEFGAKRFRQFQPFRGNQWEGDGGPGYVLNPSIRAKRDEFETVYLAAIDRLTAVAFPS